jgi:16S rRNA (cytosine1402-N4)-methyltransferase
LQIEGISTTTQLKEILQPLAQRGKENKFFAQVFQALRIEVNGEIDVLQKMLEQTSPLLKQGGRLVVMSYHSLEDRLVKNYMKTGNCEGKVEKDFFGNVLNDLELVNRKPITASQEELDRNSRSRSAKLRIAQKK